MPSPAVLVARCMRQQRLMFVRTAGFSIRAHAHWPVIASAGRRAQGRSGRQPLHLQQRGFAESPQQEAEKSAAEKPTKSQATGGREVAQHEATQTDAAQAEKGGESSSSACASGGTAPMGEVPPEDADESSEELLQKELSEAEEKLAREKRDLLLAFADFENNKKRHASEKEGRKRNAMANAARKVVEVYTEFDKVAHAEDNANLSDASKSLQEGINLTRDLYRSLLEKFEIVPLEVQAGQHVSSAKHEEVGIVEDDTVAENSIVECVKPGWILEPKSAKPVVIQRAKVKVAKHGPAKPPPPPQE